VSAFDVGADEAGHLTMITNDCCDATDARNLEGLGARHAHTRHVLDEQRRAQNRGARTRHFPWRKIVMAALL
jgi:hypothetical protein